MTNKVYTKLLWAYENWGLGSKGPGILKEAAEEIKRLESELERVREEDDRIENPPFGKMA